jgi:hypothetical protein
MVFGYRSVNLASTVILSEAKDPMSAYATAGSARSFLLCPVGTGNWQLGTDN